MAGQALMTIQDREWPVDLALSPWELEQGLGGLPELTPGTGMLFDLGYEQTITVSTAPMLFNLDIAFLSEDLTVTEIYRNVSPGYLVTSTHPARYFVEVNAGELDGIEPGSQVQLTVFLLEAASTVPDWTYSMFGLMGMLVMGTYLAGIVRNMTGEAFSEPEPKPLIYGPRGEVLMPQTTVKADLWSEIALIVQRSLGRRTDLPLDRCQRIAEAVAGKIEKRAGQLAWLELRNGTTFERQGKAPISQGLRMFAAVDGYLGISSDLMHADRVAIAGLVTDSLQNANEIRLRDGTVFLKKYVPAKVSASVEPAGEKPGGICYADAWRFVINKGEGTLVHGTVYSGGRRLGHAWVATDTDFVWEPESKKFYTKLGFRDAFAPDEQHRYSSEEAAVMVARTKHFGPWTDEERRFFKDKSAGVIPTSVRKSPPNGDLDLLADSPEYLAYTIDDIGFRDIIDSAFLEAIARARRVNGWR